MDKPYRVEHDKRGWWVCWGRAYSADAHDEQEAGEWCDRLNAAYSAGQQAQAERCKALEEALSNLCQFYSWDKDSSALVWLNAARALLSQEKP